MTVKVSVVVPVFNQGRDEAANICRIGDLPALYSHLGSRGVVPVMILQSYAQAVGVWASPARRRCTAPPP